MKSRAQQTKFQDPSFKKMMQFGGSLLKKSHAKSARPLSTKHAMHIVLRSSLAKGAWSLRTAKNQKMTERVIKAQASKYGIKIYEYANVGNHLHLLIKLGNRFTFAPFMRAITGIIALKVTGASKSADLKMKLRHKMQTAIEAKAETKANLQPKFWDYRPWTRIVEWKKAYTIAKDYVIQNHLEAIGYIAYKTRNYQKYFQKAPA